MHIKENPRNFHRFNAVWTPTVLIMDPNGEERSRLEGYLPTNEFRDHMEMGLGRVAFMKKDWAAAERRFNRVIDEFPDSKLAPQAVYYRGVSRYSASHDGAELGNTAAALKEKFQGNEWQLRSLPWLQDH